MNNSNTFLQVVLGHAVLSARFKEGTLQKEVLATVPVPGGHWEKRLTQENATLTQKRQDIELRRRIYSNVVEMLQTRIKLLELDYLKAANPDMQTTYDREN